MLKRPREMLLLAEDLLFEATENKAISVIMAATLAVTLFSSGSFFLHWVDRLDAADKAEARKGWITKTGRVVKARPLRSQYGHVSRDALVQYRDRSGRLQFIRIVTDQRHDRGDRTTVWIERSSGKPVVEADVVNGPGGYAHPAYYDVMGRQYMALILPFLVTILAAFVSAVVGIISAAIKRAYRPLKRTTPARILRALLRLGGRGIRRARDEVALRWEFWRRRKRLHATPAYRMARRLQAELARMDPTPRVIDARRRANELLTNVLDRDNAPRAEEISGTIDAIKEDIELDIKAREQALAELAQAE